MLKLIYPSVSRRDHWHDSDSAGASQSAGRHLRVTSTDRDGQTRRSHYGAIYTVEPLRSQAMYTVTTDYFEVALGDTRLSAVPL